MAYSRDFGNSPSNQQQICIKELEKENAALQDCLSLNRLFQQELVSIITEVQGMLDNNLAEQKRIQTENKRLITTKGHAFKQNKKPINLFAYPYFRDTKKRVAPENEDALLKKKRGDLTTYFSSSRPWSEKEHAALSKAVYETALQQELKPLMNSKIFFGDKLKREKLPEEDETMAIDKVELIEAEMNDLRRKPKLTLLREMKQELDWLKISAVDLDGLRGPEECEKKWKNLLHPDINRKKFTRAEDARLKFLATKQNERDWDLIAKRLNTNRTSIQCLERYQSKLNKSLFKPYWTPEEDAKLKATVKECEVGGEIPWHQVVYYMSGWSRVHITNRWNRNIKPDTQFAVWNTEEDAVLYGAQKKYVADWMKIAEFLPRRNNYACRDRFINFLAPNLKTGDWTLEEDRLLIQLVSQYGDGKWYIISRAFDDRSSHACFQRIACMKKHCSQSYKLALTRANSGCSLEGILKKQLVKSKYCPQLNQRRQQHREMAIELFEETLTMLNHTPKRPGKEHLFTEKELHGVSKELLGDLVVPKEQYGIPSYRGMERCLNYKSEEEEDPVSDSSNDSDIQEEDHEAIDKELEELFSTRAAAGISKQTRRCFTITEPKMLQFAVLKKIMLEAYNVKESTPLDSTEYHEVDFADSIERVLGMFVLPPRDPDMPPVIPPNVTNFDGMLHLLVFQNELEKMAQVEVARQATRNFMAITMDGPDVVRKCYLCRIAAKKNTPPPENCICTELKRLRERFLLFRKRFTATFLWPGILSDIPMSDEQIEKLIRKDTFNRKLSKCKEHVKVANKRNILGQPVSYSSSTAII